MDYAMDCADKIFNTREQEIRMHFVDRLNSAMLKKLSQRNEACNVANNRCYRRTYHDDADPNDRGYTDFYDTINNR